MAELHLHVLLAIAMTKPSTKCARTEEESVPEAKRARMDCKENWPLAHLVWILVFDDQQDQVELKLFASIFYI
jgi:hypothetical protein